jgi:indolepyruvate ferredoxin oxidoreductase alpha subunit
VLGTGVDPAHVVVVDAHPRRIHENAAKLKRELDYRGLSVVIAVRECKVAAKKRARIAEAVA